MPREFLEEIADHVPAIIFAKTRDGKFIYVNREYERLFRVNKEALLGRTCHDFLPRELADILTAHDQIVLSKGCPQEFEEPILVNDGQRTYSCIKFPLRDAEGAIYGVAGISTDITERKCGEEAIRATNAKLEVLINAIPDMVVFKDAAGRHQVVNTAAEEFMGLPCADLLGKVNEEVLPPEFAAACTASDARALQSPEPSRYEEAATDKSGELRYLDTIKAPIYHEEGELMGLVMVSRDITERKHQEEALQKSEHRFREYFAQVPVGMFIADDAGTFLHVNQAFCRLLGYSEQELLAPEMDFRTLSHPRDLEKHLEQFKRLMAGEIPDFTLEKRYLHKDGTALWGRVSATRRQEDGGYRYIGIVENIDDRKRAEQALRESEERFRMFADFTYDWEYWISPQGEYIYTSPACEKLTGYGPDHFQDSRQLLALIHPEDHDLFAGHLEKHLQENDQFVEIEFRIRTKQGKELWLAHACQPVHGKDGAYMGRRASNRDITERKAAEQQMKLFVDLVNQSNDGILVVDLGTGRIILANERMSQNLQYTREELLAMRPEEISTKAAEWFEQHFRKLRQTGSLLLEDSHRRKDGTILPVEVNIQYTMINHREFAVGVIRDISGRRRMEQELQKAQRLESIGLLAGGIAHDFNNILTAILGNIELARMFLPPEKKAAKRLAVAEEAAVRARGITQQLLTFAKGGAPIKKVAAVGRLIRDSVEFALRGTKVKGRFHFPASLRLIEVDEDQIRQVINNLVINAAQAMPEGGTLTVHASNHLISPDNGFDLQEGEYVRIDLTDQGVGIPEEHLGLIFDPYFTTKESGSGLGLAISYSIIKRHGGTITVHSAPGTGSTFSIFLPATDRAETMPDEEEAAQPSPGIGRVLVMDDDQTVNAIAADMLHHLGYRVEITRDGAETVAAYQRAREAGDPFDAVITDLTVPGGQGGKEVVRQLLAIDPHAKVIVSSGYANDPIMSDYADYGFKGVIPKPYRLAELGRTLQEVVCVRPAE